MTQWHMKAGTKVSGGKRMTLRRSDKRLAWKGGDSAFTAIASTDDNIERTLIVGLGGNIKAKLKLERYVAATEPGDGKAKKYEILTVAENTADTQYARRNIITKGAVLKAKDGAGEVFIRVTSRPGQSGNVSGILIKDYRGPREIKNESKKAKKAAKTLDKAEIKQNSSN